MKGLIARVNDVKNKFLKFEMEYKFSILTK